jgi:hypothetical protein
MAGSYRMVLLQRQGRHVERFGAPEITRHSVVHVAASEVSYDNGPLFGEPTVEDRIRERFVGAADVAVKNVSPREGEVFFAIMVDFPTPLDIAVDITILDPPSQTILGGRPAG